MTTHYFYYGEEDTEFFKTIKDLLNSEAFAFASEDCYVYEGELDEENYDDDADDYREVNALSYLIEDYYKIKEGNEKLKEQLNTIFPSKTEQAVISKYQVQRTNNLRTIKKLKEENKKLKEQIKKAEDSWADETTHALKHISGMCENLKKENEKLQDEIVKLKIDHSMNTQYWNCYLSYADPKADMLPEKEHIDKWCKSGDVEDWKLKEYLYDGFCIDEDDDE